MRRLREALVLLVLVGVTGAIGYHILAKLNWLDSVYMATTTLFTVGFREMGEVNNNTKLFTIFYLVTGLGVAVACHYVQPQKGPANSGNARH